MGGCGWEGKEVCLLAGWVLRRAFVCLVGLYVLEGVRALLVDGQVRSQAGERLCRRSQVKRHTHTHARAHIHEHTCARTRTHARTHTLKGERRT